MRYEIRSHTLGELLDGSFALYRDHLGTLAAVAVPLGAVGAVFFGASTGAVQRKAPGAGFAWLMAGLACELLQAAALVVLLSDAYLGRELRPVEAVARTMRRIPTLFFGALLLGAGLIGGALLLVVPALYLVVAWAVWMQPVMLEGASGWKSLARSRSLTRGSLGNLGLLLLAFTAIQWALQLGLGALLPSSLKAIPYLGVVLTDLPAILIGPLSPALLTLVYYDGRIRHEGFDLELRSSMEATTPAAAP